MVCGKGIADTFYTNGFGHWIFGALVRVGGHDVPYLNRIDGGGTHAGTGMNGATTSSACIQLQAVVSSKLVSLN